MILDVKWYNRASFIRYVDMTWKTNLFITKSHLFSKMIVILYADNSFNVKFRYFYSLLIIHLIIIIHL